VRVGRRGDFERNAILFREILSEELEQPIVNRVAAQISMVYVEGVKWWNRPWRTDNRDSARDDAPRSTTSCVRSVVSAAAQNAAAPASSNSCSTRIPAASAASCNASSCSGANQPGAVSTAPSTFLPRKSSADCKSERRKSVVTSAGVSTRSAGIGSERGVARAVGGGGGVGLWW
jgi:hypothetical protein